MAPAPPTATWPAHRHTFPRRLLVVLLLAIVRPASSQLFQPPPGAAAFAGAFSPPSPLADGGGGGGFNITTSLLFIGLVVALFLLGFLSAYLRRCADTATAARRGAAVSANAAVTAAAFAPAASGGRRLAGLDAAAMEALPVLTYATARAVKAGQGALECAVCLTEFAGDGEKLRLLPGCCHVFHTACIDVWLAAHVTCPVCRADLADPAVAAAGHVLAADIAAQAETLNHTVVVDVDMPESTQGGDSKSYQQAETAEERVDRYTLRLPERLRAEIEEAKRLRRAVSAVTAATTAPASSLALRTMSAVHPSLRWSALLRALSGPRRSDLGGSRRVAPVQPCATWASDGEGDVEAAAAAPDDAGAHMEKYYAHSLTFAGFVIDGDVAAGDWNPEIFQVSTAVPVAPPAVRRQENATDFGRFELVSYSKRSSIVRFE